MNPSSGSRNGDRHRKNLRLRVRDDAIRDGLEADAKARGCHPSDVATELLSAHYHQDPFMRASDDAARTLAAGDEREAYALLIAIFNQARARGEALDLARALRDQHTEASHDD